MVFETCPCGATYTGDGFSAINFRNAHKACREAWVQRHYGTDSTDQFDTLAEATVQPDGSLHVETVVVDKREGSAVKSEPNPGPSILHDFDCTHDPCRCEAKRERSRYGPDVCDCLRCDNCGKPSCKHSAMAHCWQAGSA